MIALARLFLLSILLTLLAGCAMWGGSDWREPEVHLVKVETVKARLLEQEFVLHLRVDNPNDSRLFIRSLGYSIWLNDLLLVEDEASIWRSVGGHARRTFKITARTNLWQHLKPLAKLLKSEKTLQYRLQGELETGLFIHRDLHLSRSGEIIPGDFIPE
ncbi:LEA type 2 family protein [Pseudomonas putida]|uniref:LEA type 2 family protein n=1 Tax=Pseudomonas putida TaxID=303 RepID=A0A7W2L3C5_PSEPU|nr:MULTISPECIES: LEA type 2 family protein [Pseudomonas]MBA6117722.1 LEA type 2 family protein [Pseudomonas putida]MBI6940713.1 LEA type 2 family protein [Pseudomonas putida]MBI6956911.1 LEA type 2 family protein [Pseudomonas putida]MCZ9636275.1 LEA type 2 family protein [Pseudomonas putida]MEC4877719.1 LEA type 2 family protein [Pseudomonas sp. NC26]